MFRKARNSCYLLAPNIDLQISVGAKILVFFAITSTRAFVRAARAFIYAARAFVRVARAFVCALCRARAFFVRCARGHSFIPWVVVLGSGLGMSWVAQGHSRSFSLERVAGPWLAVVRGRLGGGAPDERGTVALVWGGDGARAGAWGGERWCWQGGLVCQRRCFDCQWCYLLMRKNQQRC
jgi:hypothetical protein